MKRTSLSEIVGRFPNKRVLVVGDAILDHYIVGQVSRTSPEAPVPVLHAERDEWLAGGAANVARNLAFQDAEVVFVSLIGDDDSGSQLCELLGTERRIRQEFVVEEGRLTPLKTRCVAQGQQMLRVDRENPGPPPPVLEKRILGRIRKHLPTVAGIILSDYGKGLLTPTLIESIVAEASERELEIVVDPKGTDYSRYRGVDLITPNLKEAREASGVDIVDEPTTEAAAKALQRIVRGKAVCVTLGARGVAIYPRRGRPAFIHARAREVYDVTGAGDTFIALMALARFSGGTFAEAAEIGNVAAGIAVGRSGVAAIPRAELLREIEGDTGTRKWIDEDELVSIRRSLARAGRKVVFTNGCFDLLNVHHLRLLSEASSLGDALIVALNSDESVRRIRGEPRPLLNETERAELIGSLPYVDYVTFFEEDTPNALLERLRPDILVKGDNSAEVVGREIVESYGGTIQLLATGLGPSTNEVIQRAAGTVVPLRKGKSS